MPKGVITVIEPGTIFGQLTFVSKVESKNGATRGLFNCACGTINYKTRITRVVNKETVSCGCLNGTASLDFAGKSRSNFVARYRGNAVARNLPFELTYDEADSLFKKNCHYCGNSPSMDCNKYKGQRRGRERKPTLANGIDRIDSSIGYTAANCVPCCPQCNMMKNDYSVKEFLDQVERISRHQARRADGVIAHLSAVVPVTRN